MANRLTLRNRPVDLPAVRCRAFVMAARDDQIVPWRNAYASTQLLAGKIHFILASSGYVAGVVNPLAVGKRNYRTAIRYRLTRKIGFPRLE